MMEWYQGIIIGVAALGAVWLDFRLIRYIRNHQDRVKPVMIAGRPFHILGAVVYSIQVFNRRVISSLWNPTAVFLNRMQRIRVIEIFTHETSNLHVNVVSKVLPVVLVIVWALWVGRGYMNLDAIQIPNGGDVPLHIYSHFGWNALKTCGACVFWNGAINGGQPAFSEVQGAFLHPLVIITSLLFGAINGAKIIMLVTLITLGLAQFWLARVMGLGILAGICMAAVAVAGGHLGDRMGGGLMNIVFALANATLILPPLVDVVHNHNHRSSVWIGVFLALTLLSGQGYIQAAVALGLVPALAIYWFSKSGGTKEVKVSLFFALGLTILLTAVLWVPMMHFLPAIVKDGDPYLANAAKFGMAPVYLFLTGPRSLYLGWIPILLAASTLHFVPQEKKKLVWFFILAITLVFFVSSAEFLQFAYRYIDQIALIRFPDHMTLLAVPLILALAAWGLDFLLKTPLSFSLHGKASTLVQVRLTWLLLPAVLLLALPGVYKESKWRFETHPIERPEAAMRWLTTEYTEIVHLPTPDFDWMALALDRGYKLTGVWRPWRWKDRQQPPAYLEASRDPNDQKILQIDYLAMLRYDNAHYAAVTTANGGYYPCRADAVGGKIDVECTNDRPGKLVVYENSYPGWSARVDGERALMYRSDWLVVDAPAGNHSYSFRYRPWDVWAGMALSLIGVLVAVLAWRKDRI